MTTNNANKSTQPVNNVYYQEKRVSNWIWLTLLLFGLGVFIIPIYYWAKVTSLESELKIRGRADIAKSNHFIGLIVWLCMLILLWIVPSVYYCIKANNYATILSTMDDSKQK